jgi:Holliday junction resolvase RusA-like endonuclease
LRTYTPAETVSWEGLAIHIMRQHHRGPPSEEPMKVHVVAVGKRPKRLMREKDPPGRIWRTAKPDGDNILKAVCDAMTKAGIVVDDSYLSDKRVLSVYAAKGEQPCVEIEWYQLSPDGYPAVIP